MRKEEHTPEERAGIEHYLDVLAHKHMPLDISNAVAEIREQYNSMESLRPTQIAILQRCFRRATRHRYEIDWFPINVLDMAIATELDGLPQKALLHDDMACALKYLGNMRDAKLKSSVNAEVESIEVQLLLTGWLSREQLDVLHCAYLISKAALTPATYSTEKETSTK